MTNPKIEETLLQALRDITRHTYGMQSIMEEHSDVNAFNYHAKEYYLRLTNSYKATASKALRAYEDSRTSGKLTDTELFERLKFESWDLRSVNVATGGDDYAIHWVVMEHHDLGEPDVEVGRSYGDDPREAIRDAIRKTAPHNPPIEA